MISTAVLYQALADRKEKLEPHPLGIPVRAVIQFYPTRVVFSVLHVVRSNANACIKR